MHDISLAEWQVQLESHWLPLRMCVTIVPIGLLCHADHDVVHRHNTCVVLLAAFLLEAYIMFVLSGKLTLGSFQVSSYSGTSGTYF